MPNSRTRSVEPELLDVLPASHPDAKRSRGDLELINGLMGNNRWIMAQLGKHLASGRRGTGWELGAGDGRLGANIAKRFGTDAIRLSGLDLAARSPHWPEAWDWRQADILTVADKSPPADLVIANLILHHFQDRELAQIGRWISSANTIIAVEPLRANTPHILAYALRLVGINYVTREDIHTSIRAGFRADELPQLLGLDPADWHVRTACTPLGAYRMIATRHQQKS